MLNGKLVHKTMILIINDDTRSFIFYRRSNIGWNCLVSTPCIYIKETSVSALFSCRSDRSTHRSSIFHSINKFFSVM